MGTYGDAVLDGMGMQMGMPTVSRQKLEMVHEHALKGLEIMKRAGVKMGFRTDLLGEQHTRQGSEFTLRSQVLTPFDILHSATAINAEILQMKNKLGVIKAGAFADLLLVDGNPPANINLLAANGRHLTHIMVDDALSSVLIRLRTTLEWRYSLLQPSAHAPIPLPFLRRQSNAGTEQIPLRIACRKTRSTCGARGSWWNS